MSSSMELVSLTRSGGVYMYHGVLKHFTRDCMQAFLSLSS